MQTDCRCSSVRLAGLLSPPTRRKTYLLERGRTLGGRKWAPRLPLRPSSSFGLLRAIRMPCDLPSLCAGAPRAKWARGKGCRDAGGSLRWSRPPPTAGTEDMSDVAGAGREGHAPLPGACPGLAAACVIRLVDGDKRVSARWAPNRVRKDLRIRSPCSAYDQAPRRSG